MSSAFLHIASNLICWRNSKSILEISWRRLWFPKAMGQRETNIKPKGFGIIFILRKISNEIINSANQQKPKKHTQKASSEYKNDRKILRFRKWQPKHWTGVMCLQGKTYLQKVQTILWRKFYNSIFSGKQNKVPKHFDCKPKINTKPFGVHER